MPGSIDLSLFPVAAWRRCILRALDGYLVLPAQAGLHIAIVRPELPTDQYVWSVLESRDFQIGSLRRTYHFNDPSPGFLVGFGALPTTSVFAACRGFADVLGQIDHS